MRVDLACLTKGLWNREPLTCQSIIHVWLISLSSIVRAGGYLQLFTSTKEKKNSANSKVFQVHAFQIIPKSGVWKMQKVPRGYPCPPTQTSVSEENLVEIEHLFNTSCYVLSCLKWHVWKWTPVHVTYLWHITNICISSTYACASNR